MAVAHASRTHAARSCKSPGSARCARHRPEDPHTSAPGGRRGCRITSSRPPPAARFEGTPSGIRNGAPVPGEHTCDILREVGCDDAGIEAKVAAKVLREENAQS